MHEAPPCVDRARERTCTRPGSRPTGRSRVSAPGQNPKRRNRIFCPMRGPTGDLAANRAHGFERPVNRPPDMEEKAAHDSREFLQLKSRAVRSKIKTYRLTLSASGCVAPLGAPPRPKKTPEAQRWYSQTTSSRRSPRSSRTRATTPSGRARTFTGYYTAASSSS